MLAGCSTGGTGADGAETTQSPQVSYGMAGAPRDVIVSREALESTPTPPSLDTPEDAVRSYLDWVSYGYRVAQPQFAEPTMSETEAVRVDAYNEYNIQKGRILDQTLKSITFGKPSVSATSTTVPAEEHWTYRYVSLTEPGKTIDGPFEVRYDTVYTLVKTDRGWVVDSVKATIRSDSE